MSVHSRKNYKRNKITRKYAKLKRVNPSREFFECPLQNIKIIFDKVEGVWWTDGSNQVKEDQVKKGQVKKGQVKTYLVKQQCIKKCRQSHGWLSLVLTNRVSTFFETAKLKKKRIER